MELLASGRNLLKIMLCIGFFQIAGHYLAGALVRSDGGMAIPQPDTLLYCQAARRIAEKCPFSFSAGVPVTTGTTSVLHPFVLTVPYIAGYRGDTLIRAGFVLNAGFFLLFLIGWWMVVDAKLSAPVARISGAVIVAAFGQTAFSCFAQSDIGMWLAVSGLLAGGLATGRRALYGSMLLLAPWVRPEGMVCVMGFVLAVTVFSFFSKRPNSVAQRDKVLAGFSAASMVGVFALNFFLTGHVGFSSVAQKGYFTLFPFPQAIFATACDFMKVAKAILFGIPQAAPRDLYFLPVLGAGLMWLGILGRPWKEKSCWREFAWLLAVGGGLLTIAQSGWQNTNVDRYIGWLMPLGLVFSAGGLGILSRFSHRGTVAAWIAAVLMMGFGLGMSVVHMCMLNMTSRESDLLRAFAVECEGVMPKGAALGTWGDCGIAYELSSRRIAHLAGIYSPEFLVANRMVGALEVLKNEPATRFDYWFSNPAEEDKDLGFKTLGVLGEQLRVGPNGYELRKAKWGAMDSAASIPAPPCKGVSFRTRLDVGYDADEKTCEYEVVPRYDLRPQAPFMLHDKLNGVEIVDGARLLVGGDEMSIDATPGCDLWVVMRVHASHELTLQGGFSDRRVLYAFANPLLINVMVDGTPVGVFPLKTPEKGFGDVAFKIPGTTIVTSRPRISIQGDRIVSGYWFFQQGS